MRLDIYRQTDRHGRHNTPLPIQVKSSEQCENIRETMLYIEYAIKLGGGGTLPRGPVKHSAPISLVGS